MARLTDSERGTIVSLLQEHGSNRTRVARMVGRSSSTVQKIAVEEGIPPNIRAPKKANEARGSYAEERRLEIIGRAFDKADDMLATVKEAADFQKWTVAFGTLVDKARLETGQATDRHENRSGPLDLSGMSDEELERFARSLDEPAGD